MEDRLTLFLDQRAVMLASEDASLALLRRHDRRLLSFMAQGRPDDPVLQPGGDDEALLALLLADSGRWLVVLEARERCWPGELARLHQVLVEREEGASLAWWLAACYPHLACPEEFPADFELQISAALALLRRDRDGCLPEPWDQWARALRGEMPIVEIGQRLWVRSGSRGWQQWMGPLLAVAPGEDVVALVNRLSGQMPDDHLVELMGRSCQGRFLPWLQSMGEDPVLAPGVVRELLWLQGPVSAVGDGGVSGRLCRGRPFTRETRPSLFHTVPLVFRERLFSGYPASVLGSSVSLQGGGWCSGK